MRATFFWAGEALPSADREIVTPVTDERSAARRRAARPAAASGEFC